MCLLLPTAQPLPNASQPDLQNNAHHGISLERKGGEQKESGSDQAGVCKLYKPLLCGSHEASLCVASPFVSLHVAADAESLPTTRVSAFERLLARVTVTVDLEAAWA